MNSQQQISSNGTASVGDANPPVISSSGLAKHLGPIHALDGIDISIRKGETFGFLGPNGSGKTTFIRMVAGLLNPTAGKLTVLGSEMPSQATRVRPQTGYMTQK